METLLLYIVFVVGLMSELIIIVGAWYVAKRRLLSALAKRNLEVNVFALECKESEDPDLFRLGNKYAELMRRRIWNGISGDLDRKFAAYQTHMDIRLKSELDTFKAQLSAKLDTYPEMIQKAVEAEIKTFLEEFTAMQKKMTATMAGQKGGEMKAINASRDQIESLMGEMQQENNPLVKNLKKAASSRTMSKKNRMLARMLLEYAESYGSMIAQQQSPDSY